MFAEHYNTLLVLAGASLLGLTAGVVGCFAVLRQRALLGDAIGHATLPGLCLGYAVTPFIARFIPGIPQRSFPILLAGALITGLASVFVFSGLMRLSRLRADAGIAIVLSIFYAAGAVWLSIIMKEPNSGQAGLESFLFGSTASMIWEDVVWIIALAIVSLTVVVILLKELTLIAFDAEFARVQGWPAARIDLILMVLIAVAVVIGLPAVGALLIAAMLVIPAAAARFWTNRLGVMLAIAGLFGLVSGATGAAVSSQIASAPTGPAIILAATALFAGSMLFGTARGILVRRRAVQEEVKG